MSQPSSAEPSLKIKSRKQKDTSKIRDKEAFAPTSQPPKKVCLSIKRQVYWLVFHPPVGLPTIARSGFFNSRPHLQLRGQLRHIPNSLLNHKGT